MDFFRRKEEEQTEMKDREGIEGGPDLGEDSTLLEERREEENPGKDTLGDMSMPVWDLPR